MIIAVDFDGTCVTHDYPKVGKDIGAIPVLRRLTDAGHQLILFTMRSYMHGVSPVTNKDENGGLSDAVKWFKDNNIPLWAVNENPDQRSWTESPKPYAQLYIDDAALGCPCYYKPETHSRPFVNWNCIEELLQQKGLI